MRHPRLTLNAPTPPRLHSTFSQDLLLTGTIPATLGNLTGLNYLCVRS